MAAAMNAEDTARATRSEVTRRAIAREDVKPSGRQRAYIARLALELLDVPFPESRRDADAVIKRLRAAVESATTADAEIPF